MCIRDRVQIVPAGEILQGCVGDINHTGDELHDVLQQAAAGFRDAYNGEFLHAAAHRQFNGFPHDIGTAVDGLSHGFIQHTHPGAAAHIAGGNEAAMPQLQGNDLPCTGIDAADQGAVADAAQDGGCLLYTSRCV